MYCVRAFIISSALTPFSLSIVAVGVPGLKEFAAEADVHVHEFLGQVEARLVHSPRAGAAAKTFLRGSPWRRAEHVFVAFGWLQAGLLRGYPCGSADAGRLAMKAIAITLPSIRYQLAARQILPVFRDQIVHRTDQPRRSAAARIELFATIATV